MSREVLDSRSSYDEVYDDRPERAPRRRSPLRIHIPRRWLTTLRSIAPLAIAFVIGLVIGGAGWNEWQAQRAVAAARSAISFTAEMTSADATSSGIEAYVALTNTGTEIVTIDDVAIVNSAVRSSSRRETGAVEAAPDKPFRFRVLLEADCTQPRSTETTVLMQVRTIDGVKRSSELSVEDNDGWFESAAYAACPDPNDGFIPLNVTYGGASTVIDDGGPALRMPVSVTSWEPIAATVLAMSAASSKLSVAIDGLPIEFTGGTDPDRVVVTTTWRVVDCQDVEDLRYEELGFMVEAQRPGGIAITFSVPADPNLALGIAKFANDTCRAA